MQIPHEVPQILRDHSSWWAAPHAVRPKPLPHRRRNVAEIQRALDGRRPLIQDLRGPRQVGKTSALCQIVETELKAGTRPTEVLLVRFDLPPVQESGLLPILRWYEQEVLGRSLESGEMPLVLLDEVHELPHWADDVNHLYDAFPLRLVITGSSSVLVARGQRESLAGRAVTIDFPPFLLREVLECRYPGLAVALPPPTKLPEIIAKPARTRELFTDIAHQPPQRRVSVKRILERYYNRGGYPRLQGEDGGPLEDTWADYLVEGVFDRVLGIDIPDLFPVEQPRLLRHIYLEVARRSGTEVSQGALTTDCNTAGFKTTQPVMGRYLRYLAGAMLNHEFRRYPPARKRSARVPMKVTLTDLGVRKAIFRGGPSLWESAPDVAGPLVETLVQSALRGTGLQVHLYRDYSVESNRRSAREEVDFVPEAVDGTAIPVEVKFRKRIDEPDISTVRSFLEKLGAPIGLFITRETRLVTGDDPVLRIPVLDFLLAFHGPSRGDHRAGNLLSP